MHILALGLAENFPSKVCGTLLRCRLVMIRSHWLRHSLPLLVPVSAEKREFPACGSTSSCCGLDFVPADVRSKSPIGCWSGNLMSCQCTIGCSRVPAVILPYLEGRSLSRPRNNANSTDSCLWRVKATSTVLFSPFIFTFSRSNFYFLSFIFLIF